MTDLTSQTPVEIDTALAEVYERGYRAQRETARQRHYLTDYEEGLAKFEAGDLSYRTYTAAKVAETRERYEAALAAEQAVWAEAEPFEAEYVRRGRWTRAFLVVTEGSGGHVHSSMHCSTCYPTTEYAWLPELSGSDEAAIVAAAASDACTICYPTAPVETAGPRTAFSKAERKTAEEKAARRAELDAKRAAKAAKAIVDVDGSPLRGRWGTIATERTAQIEYVDNASDAAIYQAQADEPMPTWVERDEAEWRTHMASLAAEYRTTAERILAALAAKRGTTVEAQREALAAKVTAKVRAYSR